MYSLTPDRAQKQNRTSARLVVSTTETGPSDEDEHVDDMADEQDEPILVVEQPTPNTSVLSSPKNNDKSTTTQRWKHKDVTDKRKARRREDVDEMLEQPAATTSRRCNQTKAAPDSNSSNKKQHPYFVSPLQTVDEYPSIIMGRSAHKTMVSDTRGGEKVTKRPSPNHHLLQGAMEPCTMPIQTRNNEKMEAFQPAYDASVEPSTNPGRYHISPSAKVLRAKLSPPRATGRPSNPNPTTPTRIRRYPQQDDDIYSSKLPRARRESDRTNTTTSTSVGNVTNPNSPTSNARLQADHLCTAPAQVQPGAFYVQPTSSSDQDEDEVNDINAAEMDMEVAIVGIAPRQQRQQQGELHLPVIEANRVIEPQMAEAKPAWSQRKLAFVGLALMAVTGISVGVGVATIDREPEEKEPLPVFETKEDLRLEIESYIAGNTTQTSHPIGLWDVSNISDFSELLAALHEGDLFETFNEDISTWETSQVNNMSGMFRGARSFNHPLHMWDVSTVTDMSFLFADAAAFDQSIQEWNVSSVANMESMFDGAASFNQPLMGWDTSSVVNMKALFRGAASFDSDIHVITSLITDASSMFEGATSFNRPVSCLDMSSVIDMSAMFKDATAFNQALDAWDVASVTSAIQMFWGASAFNGSLGRWDTSAMQYTSLMFCNASSFNRDINGWDVSKVTYMDGMFWGAEAFNQPLEEWDVASVFSMRQTFKDASNFDQSLNGWNVSRVEDMVEMFAGARSYNKPMDAWDVSKVRASPWAPYVVGGMYKMFKGASLFNQPLNDWNVEDLKYMDEMFMDASAFRQDLCSWGAQLDPESVVTDAFMNTACPNTSDPILGSGPPGLFCFSCE